MATVSKIYWVPESDRASSSDTEITYIRVYRVVYDPTDLPLPSAYHAIFADDGTTAIPSRGDEFENEDGGSDGTGIYVTKIDPQRTNEPHIIDVYVTYSSVALTTFPEASKWNKTISSDAVEFTETTTRDKDSILIKNSAGDSVATPKTRFDRKYSVKFSTNDVSVINSLDDLQGKINSDSVSLNITKGGITVSKTFAAYTLKFLNSPWSIVESGTEGHPGSFGYLDVSVELGYRADTWLPKIVDMGLRQKNADTGEVGPIVDDNGNPITSEVPLDGFGQPLDTSGGTTAVVFAPAPGGGDQWHVDDEAAFAPFLSSL